MSNVAFQGRGTPHSGLRKTNRPKTRSKCRLFKCPYSSNPTLSTTKLNGLFCEARCVGGRLLQHQSSCCKHPHYRVATLSNTAFQGQGTDGAASQNKHGVSTGQGTEGAHASADVRPTPGTSHQLQPTMVPGIWEAGTSCGHSKNAEGSAFLQHVLPSTDCRWLSNTAFQGRGTPKRCAPCS